MSLTSYRAAPPRDSQSEFPPIAIKGKREGGGLVWPGGDRLFRRLSGSTMGAEGFHGRVRDGIGCLAPRYGHQAQRVMCGEGEVSVGVLGFDAARGRRGGAI